jgi:hypothetical protein
MCEVNPHVGRIESVNSHDDQGTCEPSMFGTAENAGR